MLLGILAALLTWELRVLLGSALVERDGVRIRRFRLRSADEVFDVTAPEEATRWRVEREIPVDIHFTGFVIPDRFVIGYGLDYAGLYRELPGIYSLG